MYQIYFAVSDEKLDELKMMFLEEEVKELKRFLREEKSKNQYLTNLAEVAEKQRDKKQCVQFFVALFSVNCLPDRPSL